MNQKTWDDAKVGEDLGSVQQRLTAEEIDKHSWAIEDQNPWYAGESPFGGGIVAPLMTANNYVMYYDHAGYAREGFFHAKIEHENINPLRRGKQVTTRGRIADKYIRRGRKYIIIETVVTDEDGMEICRNNTTLASIRTFPED